MAEATQERRLLGVGSSAGLGAGDDKDIVFTCLLPRPLPLYSFNSFFSSLRKRQSVPSAMSFCGLALTSPTSWRRKA
jgi:hypothetical protein